MPSRQEPEANLVGEQSREVRKEIWPRELL